MEKETVSSQPQGSAPMTAGGNRNALNREIGADGHRDWSYGLFDCFADFGLCCWSTWCPCIVFTKNKQRVQHLQSRGTPLPGGGEPVDGTCALYACLGMCGYGWVLQVGNRSDIRARYSVRGGTASDCLTSWCCHCCALIQEGREIELEEHTFEGGPQ